MILWSFWNTQTWWIFDSETFKYPEPVSIKIIRYPPHTGVACSIFFVSTHSQHISMLIVFVFPLRIITRALNSHAYLLISNCHSYKGIHPFFGQLWISCCLAIILHQQWCFSGLQNYLPRQTLTFCRQIQITIWNSQLYCPTRNIMCPSHKIHLLMKVICFVKTMSPQTTYLSPCSWYSSPWRWFRIF